METYCQLAAEYNMPAMLRSVDGWLAMRPEVPLPTFQLLGAPKRDDAARAIARMLALARAYKLRRFAEAAKSRLRLVGNGSSENLLLVMSAELDLVIQ